MHDLAAFRKDLDTIAGQLRRRGFELDVARFRNLDAQRRSAMTQTEQMRAERKNASDEINRLRKAGEDTIGQQQSVREMGERITGLEAEVRRLDESFQDLMASIPNLPHEIVCPAAPASRQRRGAPLMASRGSSISSPRPIGISDRRWAFWIWIGPPRSPGRGSPSTGGIGAQLERALINFMLDVHTRRAWLHGGAATVSGQLRSAFRDRPVAEVRRRPVQASRTTTCG